MKKVLIIKKSLGGGGAERILVDTLRLWDYNRFEVTLLTSDSTGVYSTQLDPRVRVCQVRDIWSSFLLRNLFYTFPFLRRCIMGVNHRRARKVLGRNHYDIAISYLEGRSASMHQGLLDVADRNVTWVHIDLYANPWSRRYHISAKSEMAFYKAVDEIVFVSEAARRQFDLYIPEHAPTRVVYNLIVFDQVNAKAEMFQPDLDAPAIVSVGRLAPQKRFDRLIKSVQLLREAGVNANLYILGEGKLKRSLEQLSASERLDDRIHFVGFVQNPYPYIKAADMFVSSSDTEGYPLVIAEAMCLGKPIVATAVTGSTEMLSGGAGILVEPNDQAIADACATLLKDERARSALGKMAQAAAQERFDVEAYMEVFYRAIEGE